MSKNRNIVVFWIDEAPREDFLTRLRDAGIQAFTADNYVDGVQWLSNPKNIEICDAVILDVNCKIRHSDEHESTDSFRDYAYRVLSRCEEESKHIPWFVFTTGSGYDESLLNAIPQREWTRRRFYRKDTDQQQLINDIRELTKHSGNVAPFSFHLSPFTFHLSPFTCGFYPCGRETPGGHLRTGAADCSFVYPHQFPLFVRHGQ